MVLPGLKRVLEILSAAHICGVSTINMVIMMSHQQNNHHNEKIALMAEWNE